MTRSQISYVIVTIVHGQQHGAAGRPGTPGNDAQSGQQGVPGQPGSHRHPGAAIPGQPIVMDSLVHHRLPGTIFQVLSFPRNSVLHYGIKKFKETKVCINLH